MSTASPLPLQPLPEALLTPQEGQQFKREIADRLEQHRRRRQAHTATSIGAQTALPGIDATPRPSDRASRLADSVAARFAQTLSYRDFLAQEAEAATRQAEAAADIARRNADAIAAAHQHLLSEIAAWEQTSTPACIAETAPALADILPFTATFPSQTANHASPIGLEGPKLSGIAASPWTQANPDNTALTLELTPTEPPAGTARTASFAARLRQSNAATPPSPATAPDSTPSAQSAFATAFTQARSATATSLTASTITTAAPATGTPFTLPAHHGPIEPPIALPTNLIEFPRQLIAARKVRPRLAEGPLREEADAAPNRTQLRIFEVEPDAFSTIPLAAAQAAEGTPPVWSSIRLDAHLPQRAAAIQSAFDTPLYPAALGTRVMAAAVDAACVSTAFLLAVATAAYASPALPTGLAALLAAAGTLALFTVLYLLCFFIFSDSTPGMRYARIALCTFSDDNPSRAAIRRRLLAMLLAAIPLGLGFAWALLDDDRLGWHDRISRIYQREY